MNNWMALLQEAEIIARTRAISKLIIMERGYQVCKFRLQINEDLIVQVYRNDKYDTTNFALILGRIRLYGRDKINGKWHRHAIEKPSSHDLSPEGAREVSLTEFWDEVEAIIQNLGLASML